MILIIFYTKQFEMKIKVYIVFLLFLTLTQLSPCQQYNHAKKDLSEFYVQFISKFSTKEDIVKSKGVIKSIVDFVIGKENEKLIKPFAIIAKDSSSIIVLDQQWQNLVRIDKLNINFKIIEFDKVKAFPSLVGIAWIDVDNIAITDSRLNKIFRCNLKNERVSVLNDSLEISQPTGIAYSNKYHQFWVSETAKHRILILDENGEIVKTIGQRGTKQEEFNFPTNIIIDKSEKVYIVDAMNFRIQMFSSDGKFLGMFGEVGDASGYFASPKGIATDTYGHIYVADAVYHAVQVFNSKGDFLYSFGRQGTGDGEFWMPTGIYIDENNQIYVTDSYNGRVQIFKLVKRV